MSLKRSAVNVLVWLAALTAGLACIVLANPMQKNLASMSNYDCTDFDGCDQEIYVI